MDPYLEEPGIWPDLHASLACGISGMLNATLPLPYYARLDRRLEFDGEPGTLSEPLRHHFVEIRDPTQGHRLITLIEIVSPSNKRPGPDRDAYQRKQREVLESDASLIEMDLLRTGERLLRDQILVETVAQREQPPAYLVVVNRAWRRGERCHWQLFPIGLRDLLPCIAVPLRESEPEVTLDLQHVFNRAYDDGPYHRGAVNYAAPPRPPLPDADAGWAAQMVAAWQQAG